MDDQAKAALAAAVVGGYVLGRTRKGRLAISVATYLAGRRFGLGPRQLAAEGMRRLAEIPQFAELQEQLRGEVLDVGRQAVAAVANRGLATLADGISDRTLRLGGTADDEDADEYGDEYEDEDEDEDEGEGEEREEDEPPEETSDPRAGRRGPAAPARKATSRKDDAPGSAARAKKSPGKKAAPAKKSAARKTASAKRSDSRR
ncbi:histone protein [Streptomyces sp. NPDC102402]|uniref:histone protein n=1 Tax=Streptomyces sp. NPDC102402 TaxID=3366169 RepID=UPI0037F756BC